MNLQTGFLLYAACFRLAIIAAGMVSIVLGYRLFRAGIGDGTAKSPGNAIQAEVGTLKFALRNYAPGTAFALFGVIMVSVMLAQGNPELTIKTASALPAPTATSKPSSASYPAASSPAQDPGANENRLAKASEGPAPGTGQPSKADPAALAPPQQFVAEVNVRGSGRSSLSTFEDAVARAESFDHERKTEKAIGAYQQAFSSLATPLNQLAWDYLKQGRVVDALAPAKLATDLNPDEPDFVDTFARALARAGRCDEANKWMQRAKELYAIKRPGAKTEPMTCQPSVANAGN